MLNISLATGNRKEAVARLAQITGEFPFYTKVPRCAYVVGAYIIEKDGSVTVEEGADLEPLRTMVGEGLIKPFEDQAAEPAEPAETEPMELKVSLSTSQHTGSTLRNLVNTIYTRAGLINKAMGTDFSADHGLIDVLGENEKLHTAEDFCGAIAAYEKGHGPAFTGITFSPEKITFFLRTKNTSSEYIRAFTELASMMNKQALSQKRIQAKEVDEENEKYALRIWLTRLGMNGPEYKETRKILMTNLSGHSAFRTKADEERWKARQLEKRESLRAAKAASTMEPGKEGIEHEVSE